MARAYSNAFKSTLAATGAQEVPVLLLELNHTGLTQPVRVINDTQDLTCNGNLYIACGFTCTLPDDVEGQLPRAKLSVDNIGRELMYWIESTHGAEGTTATFKQVMRSNPNLVEWQITMNLYNITATAAEVSAELGFENLLGRPAIHVRYDPSTAAGLF